MITSSIRSRLTAVAVAAALLLGGSAIATAQPGPDAGQSAVAASTTCLGARATLSSKCSKPYKVTSRTKPAVARTDIGKGVREVDDCKQFIAVPDVKTCTIGSTKPKTTLALIGDSHAGVVLEPFDKYGKAHGIRFVTYIKTWCAGTGAKNIFVQGGSPEIVKSCTDWGKAALKDIRADKKIEGVVFTNFTGAYANPSDPNVGRAITTKDYLRAWKPLIAAGKKVIVLRDVPNAGAVAIPDCVAARLDKYDPCSTKRSVGLLAANEDPQLLAAKKLSKVSVVDVTDVFCDAKRCHSVIGGLVVYFDSYHLTATFSRSMASVLGRRVVAALD